VISQQGVVLGVGVRESVAGILLRESASPPYVNVARGLARCPQLASRGILAVSAGCRPIDQGASHIDGCIADARVRFSTP